MIVHQPTASLFLFLWQLFGCPKQMDIYKLFHTLPICINVELLSPFLFMSHIQLLPLWILCIYHSIKYVFTLTSEKIIKCTSRDKVQLRVVSVWERMITRTIAPSIHLRSSAHVFVSTCNFRVFTLCSINYFWGYSKHVTISLSFPVPQYIWINPDFPIMDQCESAFCMENYIDSHNPRQVYMEQALAKDPFPLPLQTSYITDGHLNNM